MSTEISTPFTVADALAYERQAIAGGLHNLRRQAEEHEATARCCDEQAASARATAAQIRERIAAFEALAARLEALSL
jgi:hypothetical protein